MQNYDFQRQFSMSKMIQIFLIFFLLKSSFLGTHFLLLTFFDLVECATVCVKSEVILSYYSSVKWLVYKKRTDLKHQLCEFLCIKEIEKEI